MTVRGTGTRRRLLATGVAVAVGVLLVGCGSDGDDSAAASVSPGSSATASATGSTSATVTATATPSATPTVTVTTPPQQVAVPPPAENHAGVGGVTYGPTPTHVPPPASPVTQAPPPPAPPAPPPAPPAPIADGRMTIANFAFSPSVVTFRVGQRVVVTNNDSAAHTWTSAGGGFDTGLIQPGDSATVTLTRAGTFSFLCTPHPNMTGTVTVTD